MERIMQAIATVRHDNADLTKIQAPDTAQPRTPQLAKVFYIDIQVFSDQNLGSSDTTGHEIILISLAMGKSDSNEFSISIYYFTQQNTCRQ